MRFLTWPVIVAMFACCNCAWSQQWAHDLFPTKSHDFGTVVVGAKAEFRFLVKNNTDREIHIASVRSSCGCSDVRIENATLQTYETGAVVATVNSERLRGKQTSTLTVVLDRPYRAEVQLRVAVFIRGDVVVSPPEAAFGDLPVGTSAERVLAVTRFGKPDWKIEKVESPHPHLSTEWEETERSASRVSYRLKVRLDEQASAGHLRETILLVTNDRANATFPVMVQGRLSPEITVAPTAVFWGVVAPGEKATRQIVVRAKHPFKIARAWADCDCIQFALPPSDTPKTLHLLPVTFTATGAERGMRRTLHVETDDGRVVELLAHAAVKGT